MHKGATIVASIGEEQATMLVTEVFSNGSFVGKLTHDMEDAGAGEELFLDRHEVTIMEGV